MVRSCIASLATALAILGEVHCSPSSNHIALDQTLSKQKPRIWPSQKYVTESFKAVDMAFNKTGPTADGYLFINPYGNGTHGQGAAIMTEDNDLIWHGPVEDDDTTNLRLQTYKDQTVLTYWNGTSTATFGHGYGSVQILDNTYKQIAQVCMPDLDIVTPGHIKYPCYLDMHESFITNHSTLIFTAYNVTKYDLTSVGGRKDGWIFDSMFFEVDIASGDIVFQWSSLAHASQIPINTTHAPLQGFGKNETDPFDYFHINSVQPLRDGYLVNGRHTFTFYKINRQGEVEWQLEGINGGDYTLAEGIRFSWQHMPRLIEHDNDFVTIHLFNNDNSEYESGKHQTTGLELTIDQRSKHAALDRKLYDPEEKLYADSQGAYNSLDNGHAIIGYGQLARVREFNKQGEIVYSAQFGYSTKKSMVASYRAYKYTWTATPYYKPKAVAQTSGKITNVYASWNGATEVDRWTVYAGNSKTYMNKLVTVRKSGFETVIPLSKSVKYVQVAAKKGSTTLSESEVVKVEKVS